MPSKSLHTAAFDLANKVGDMEVQFNVQKTALNAIANTIKKANANELDLKDVIREIDAVLSISVKE